MQKKRQEKKRNETKLLIRMENSFYILCFNKIEIKLIRYYGNFYRKLHDVTCKSPDIQKQGTKSSTS